MDFLTVVPAAGQGFRHEIGRESLRIGRSSGNDLALDDLNVSRVHAEIVRRPEGHYLLDAGGKNGTYVNERRIAEPALLRPGDRIRLGATTLIFNGAPQSPIEFSDRPLLPATLWEAVDVLKVDPFYRARFGDTFIDYLVTMKENEVKRFQKAVGVGTVMPDEVSEWEHNEYFELF